VKRDGLRVRSDDGRREQAPCGPEPAASSLVFAVTRSTQHPGPTTSRSRRCPDPGPRPWPLPQLCRPSSPPGLALDPVSGFMPSNRNRQRGAGRPQHCPKGAASRRGPAPKPPKQPPCVKRDSSMDKEAIDPRRNPSEGEPRASQPWIKAARSLNLNARRTTDPVNPQRSTPWGQRLKPGP